MSIMVYEQVKEKITPDFIINELKRLDEYKFSPRLNRWIKGYYKVGKRTEFIWKWLYKINNIWVHVKIDDKFTASLAEVKTLYNMFIVLLDDAAEKEGKEKLLKILLTIPFLSGKSAIVSGLDEQDKSYFLFTQKVWQEIVNILRGYPFFDEINEVFMYDTKQFLNAVVYANLIYRKPYLINEKEFWLYIPHSMQILIDLDMDLMCVTSLVHSRVGMARHTILVLQEMGRIGNWLTTWEREVKDNDYTSLVAGRALYSGAITQRDLQSKDKSALTRKIKESGSEEYLFQEWEKRYVLLKEVSEKSEIIDTEKILEKARYLLTMHLMSRGYK